MNRSIFEEDHNLFRDSFREFVSWYGYMQEYPIAKAFIDTRVATIYGGTNEIMKEIIGRGLGLDADRGKNESR